MVSASPGSAALTSRLAVLATVGFASHSSLHRHLRFPSERRRNPTDSGLPGFMDSPLFRFLSSGGGLCQLDLPKAFPLNGDQLLELGQLEHGKKRRDDLEPAPGRLEQLNEPNGFTLRKDSPDEDNLIRNSPLVGDDLPSVVSVHVVFRFRRTA